MYFLDQSPLCTGSPSTTLSPSMERGTENQWVSTTLAPPVQKWRDWKTMRQAPDLPGCSSLRPSVMVPCPHPRGVIFFQNTAHPCLLPTASPFPHQLNCHSWLAWRQVRTGRNLGEAENSGKSGPLAARAALLFPIKLVWRLVDKPTGIPSDFLNLVLPPLVWWVDTARCRQAAACICLSPMVPGFWHSTWVSGD